MHPLILYLSESQYNIEYSLADDETETNFFNYAAVEHAASTFFFSYLKNKESSSLMAKGGVQK